MNTTEEEKRFTEEEKEQLLQDVRATIANAQKQREQSEKLSEEIKNIDTKSLDDKIEEFKRAFDENMKKLVQNIGAAMGVKVKGPNYVKPIKHKNPPKEIEYKEAMQKINIAKKILLVIGQQDIDHASKKILTLNTFVNKPELLWQQLKIILNSLQPQDLKKDRGIIQEISQQGRGKELHVINTSIFQREEFQDQCTYINGSINMMRCKILSCSQYRVRIPIDIQNLNTSNLQVPVQSKPQTKTSSPARQAQPQPKMMGLVQSYQMLNDDPESYGKMFSNSQKGPLRQQKQTVPQQKQPSQQQAQQQPQNLGPLFCQSCKQLMRPDIFLEDEPINPIYIKTNEIIDYGSSADLIVFIGKPMNQNFLIQTLAQRAIKGKVDLIEFVHDNTSQFDDGTLFYCNY